MLTVTIPYLRNPINLAVLLAQLQPQLSPDDDIYIVDDSPNRDALKVARMYGTTRCIIFVEIGMYHEALKFGIQSMIENNQHALLYLKEDAFISSTLVSNMKKSIDSPYQIISPRVHENPYTKMDPNFKLYNSPLPLLSPVDKFNPWCFLVTRQSSKSYGLLSNEYVIINKEFHI